MLGNPLEVLGVTRAFVIHAQQHQRPGDILRLAEANFRTLSKFFHPDVPGGDADMMRFLNDAISDLRDPEAFEYYLAEFSGRSEHQAFVNREIIRNDAEARRRSLEAKFQSLVNCLTNIDNFRALGIRHPSTYVAALDSQLLILNVYSEVHATVTVTEESVVTGFRFRRGAWEGLQERIPSELATRRQYWMSLPARLSTQEVSVVGYITNPQERTSAGGIRNRCDWQHPAHAWFIEELQRAKFPNAKDVVAGVARVGIVISSEGMVTVTEAIRGVGKLA